MHLCVTSKNVKWCHLIWPTLYTAAARLGLRQRPYLTLEIKRSGWSRNGW